MWLRVVDVGLESCRYVLTQMGPGHSMALTPGGAAESLDSNSKEYILTLNRRRQFIKMALETGYKSDFMGAFLEEHPRLDSKIQKQILFLCIKGTEESTISTMIRVIFD